MALDLVATAGVDADPIILATNKAVMPLDGFSSSLLMTTELMSLIAQGKLRFLLIGQLSEQGSNPSAQSQAANGVPSVTQRQNSSVGCLNL
jgi:hypothetical protein